MNYWKEVKRNAKTYPFILMAMILSYNFSIYMNWRNPIEDVNNSILALIGGCLSYIFIVPYISHYMWKQPN
jgi:hypothetical protein